MASAVQNHAFDAIDALNTLAQQGDNDALEAIKRIVAHGLARQEQTEGVLASRQDIDEVEI